LPLTRDNQSVDLLFHTARGCVSLGTLQLFGILIIRFLTGGVD